MTSGKINMRWMKSSRCSHSLFLVSVAASMYIVYLPKTLLQLQLFVRVFLASGVYDTGYGLYAVTLYELGGDSEAVDVVGAELSGNGYRGLRRP